LPEQAAQLDDFILFFDIAWCDDLIPPVLSPDFAVMFMPLHGLLPVAACAGRVATSPAMATADPSTSDVLVMRCEAFVMAYPSWVIDCALHL